MNYEWSANYHRNIILTSEPIECNAFASSGNLIELMVNYCSAINYKTISICQ